LFPQQEWRSELALRKGRFVIERLIRVSVGAEQSETEEREVALNRSFESWMGIPTGWELQNGSVSHAPEATDGQHALQLDPQSPGSKGGSRIALRMRGITLDGATRIRVMMDVKASTKREVSFSLHARRNGAIVPISKNPERDSEWIDYPGNGEWVTMQYEISLTPDIDLSFLKLYIMLRAGDDQLAYVDNVSIMLIP
jgi:hypothetical protein